MDVSRSLKEDSTTHQQEQKAFYDSINYPESTESMRSNGPQRGSQTSQGNQPQQLQTYYTTHDFDGEAKLTTTLVHALSDAIGHDVTDAEFTLYDHIDPDALDLLFKSREDGSKPMYGHLCFTVREHEVTIYSNGQIAIVPLDRHLGTDRPLR